MNIVQRQTYLDWLRIISIAGVLFLHSAMPYADHLWWHLKNRETSSILFLFVIGLHLVRMPLLFFISGTVSFYMMQRKSAGAFIKLRVVRLLIPLLVGMFIVVPPQIYLERLSQGFDGSYWDFYKTIFNWTMYPKGSLSWHHLWFIGYLFIYDVAFAPVFMYLISDRSRKLKERLAWFGRGRNIVWLALPSVIWYTLVCGNKDSLPDLVHDMPYFVYWLLFVLAGFICILVPSLMDSLQRNRRLLIGTGFITLCTFYAFVLNSDAREPAGAGILSFLAVAVRPLTAWAWVFGIIGYGKQYLNRSHSSLNYLNQAVYPFYILHQTVIVGLTYYLVQFNKDMVGMKYMCTVVLTFLITMGLFHFFIKPVALMRFLFGLKPVVKKAGKPAPEGMATARQNIPEIAA
ncbi:MAG: acyltransferase family protein [Mucilaginibacter polytrichastri]|nr:acyltransferase family protein [Mucilaginibacter polytrichastri]